MALVCNKNCSKIIEVYDAYNNHKCSQDLDAFLNATNGIVYHVKRENWLVLETENSFVTLGYDGVNFYPKDSEFFDSLDYMEVFSDIYGSEEIDGYERTLFLGETIKDIYEKNGHVFVSFDSFSVEIIPHEDDEEIPWIEKKELMSYKYVYGCERLIKNRCECGGAGKLLWNYDYVVRCDKCLRATEANTTAIDAIKAWEAGNIPRALNDIVIE